MKTRIAFILVLIVVIGNQLLIAQNIKPTYYAFPDSNAVWTNVNQGSEGMDGNPTYDFYCYRLLNEDTVINSTKYHKLFTSKDLGLQNLELAAFIRQDSLLNKIYIWVDEPFKKDVILYDFSLKEGDSLTFSKGYNVEDTFIVRKIDSIVVSGVYRKRIDLGYGYQWIEGIGSTKGLLEILTTRIPTCRCGSGSHLICYGQNDKWIYHNFTYFKSCSSLTGIEDEKNNTDIILYPNPIQNTSYLKFGSAYKKLEIINSMGVVVKTYIIENQKEVSISKNEFSSGIYFYRLYSNTMYSKSGKFIIN